MMMDKEKAASLEVLRELLARRGEGALDMSINKPENDPGLLNHSNPKDMSSGLSANTLKNVIPRHKVAGSADSDPSEILDQFEEEDGVNFAGASQGEEGNEQSAMQKLIATVYQVEDDED
jgi:hypothetical protein